MASGWTVSLIARTFAATAARSSTARAVLSTAPPIASGVTAAVSSFTRLAVSPTRSIATVAVSMASETRSGVIAAVASRTLALMASRFWLTALRFWTASPAVSTAAPTASDDSGTSAARMFSAVAPASRATPSTFATIEAIASGETDWRTVSARSLAADTLPTADERSSIVV